MCRHLLTVIWVLLIPLATLVHPSSLHAANAEETLAKINRLAPAE
jgi:hypothetical protein